MAAERERQRVVIDRVEPEIDCGRFPIQRVVGERVVVEADVFTDGHDALRCLLLWCHEGDRQWSEVEMEALPDDLFRAAFTVPEMGRYRYGVTAWADPFRTWRRDLERRVQAQREVAASLSTGASLIGAAGARARLGVLPGEGFEVHDLLSGARYTWQGGQNYVELDPRSQPAHVFRVRGRCAPSAVSTTFPDQGGR